MDIKDLMLEAQAELQEAVRSIAAELAKPRMMAEVRKAWVTAPDALKEQFKQERPEDYAALMKELKRRQT